MSVIMSNGEKLYRSRDGVLGDVVNGSLTMCGRRSAVRGLGLRRIQGPQATAYADAATSQPTTGCCNAFYSGTTPSILRRLIACLGIPVVSDAERRRVCAGRMSSRPAVLPSRFKLPIQHCTTTYHQYLTPGLDVSTTTLSPNTKTEEDSLLQ
jgi:hypothetical protein